MRVCGMMLPGNGVRPIPVEVSPVSGSYTLFEFSLRLPVRDSVEGIVTRLLFAS
jgi:hypothetical protein